MQFQLPYSGLQWSDLPYVLLGVWNPLILTLAAATFGTLIGVVIGWLRQDVPAARVVLAPYVDVTRSVPMIIQFILVNSSFALAGIPLEPLWVGVIVLSLYMSLLTSELVRACLGAVRFQLKWESRSLGMSYWQEVTIHSCTLVLRIIFPH